VEVLSPSTEAHDRGLKFAQYRQIDSLQECGLVSQTEPRVEIFRRQASGDWLLSESTGLDAKVRFDSVGCEIAVSEIYHQVSFEQS
jgi:Uma2 family endonuclease